jgi:hypothetical protein
MLILRTVKIRAHERGLLYRDRDFVRLLMPGRHWLFGLAWKIRVERVSVRQARLAHGDLEVIVKSGALAGQADVLDLQDHERALVWIDGRFAEICGAGLHAYWSVFHKVRSEVVDAREIVLEHAAKSVILNLPGSAGLLEQVRVDAESVGLLFVDGRHKATLAPGTWALWKNVGRVKVVLVDQREQALDISGQDIMTADKVTLRLNALVGFRVSEPLAAVTAIDDYRQALYRETQLALRAVVGARELDALLAEKDGVVEELDASLRRRAKALGLTIVSVGIRDLILPGEMRTLMNRVTEAKKAAEANLIVRREETAAMRSQANTAKILESSPTLMKLRELEVLEKVADKANLTVMLTEGGLADRVLKLV